MGCHPSKVSDTSVRDSPPENKTSDCVHDHLITNEKHSDIDITTPRKQASPDSSVKDSQEPNPKAEENSTTVIPDKNQVLQDSEITSKEENQVNNTIQQSDSSTDQDVKNDPEGKGTLSTSAPDQTSSKMDIEQKPEADNKEQNLDDTKKNDDNHSQAPTTSDKSEGRDEDSSADDSSDNEEKDKSKTQKTMEKAAPLTKEDIERLRTKGLEEVKKYLTILTNMNKYQNEEGLFLQSFKFAAYRLMQLNFILKAAPLSEMREYQRAAGKILAEHGGVTAFCDTIIHCTQKGYKDSEGQLIMAVWSPLVNTSVALLNFTDVNPTMAGYVVEHPKFLEFCADFIQKYSEDHMEKSIDKHDAKVLERLMSTIHNIATAEDHTAALRNAGFVDILAPYLNSPKTLTALTAIATLADLVDENEAQTLEANKEIFNILMKYLSKAMVMKKRRHNGWSASELARTLRRIARNDTNKKTLVATGAIPILVKLSKSKHIDEQREAVKALWSLSFDDSNQDVMVNENPEAIDTFIELRSSTEHGIQKACTGALWNLREKLAKSEKYKEISNQFTRNEKDLPATGDKTDQKGHIMISYQWGNQPIIKEIRDVLRKNGIKVWMDIDDMEGSTLTAMARAVEDADIVLICYSQKYKNSSNCRSEAEYAFELKKPIIPLKMERNYRPDGWLGFVIGAKLFYEFSGKYTFESRIDGLLKEIYKKLKQDVPENLVIPQNIKSVTAQPAAPVVAMATPSMGARVPVQASATVKGWSSDQVKQWIDKHGLSQDKFGRLTGIEVAFLQVLRQESPDYFYKTLHDMLKISDLLTLAKFTFALEDTII